MLTANRFYSLPPERITPRSEARFFGAIKGADGTFKRTAAGRLRELDLLLTEQFERAGVRIKAALDVGVSSGVTTLELAEHLFAAGHDAEVIGTDRLVDASIMRLFPGCRALVDSEGFALQYDILGQAIRPWFRRLDAVTGGIMVKWALNRTLPGRVQKLRSTGYLPSRQVKLVTPRLTATRRAEVIADDIMTLNPALIGRFDLVRAANIFNLHYFGEERLRTAIDHVRRYLRGPGAWLLIVRSRDASGHDGTLFRVNRAGGLDCVRRFGRGSEAERLAIDVFEARDAA